MQGTEYNFVSQGAQVITQLPSKVTVTFLRILSVQNWVSELWK